MKTISLTFLLVIISFYASAQISTFKGVSLTIAHYEEEIDDFLWNETNFLDFKVEMHRDTLRIFHPYQATQYITGEYKRIDNEIEAWKSTDDRGNNCFVFLIDLEDATWLKIEYFDRAYIIEIQLFEEDNNKIKNPDF
jgi:hypothetical protein